MPTRPSCRALATCVPGLLAGLALLAHRAPAVELAGRVVDAGDGRPLAARIYLRGADGAWHFVRSSSPDGTAVRYEKQNWVNKRSVEMHVTVSAHPFIADVPPGRYELLVERGKEYFPERREVDVGSERVEVEVRLRRWIDMAARGWYSGDTHVHRTIDELRNVAIAEDLNVTFPLTYWVTKAGTAPSAGDKNSAEAVPEGLIRVDETHAIWPRNTEYEIFTVAGRQHTLGALFLLNHRGVPSDGVPPWGPVARKAAAEGALLDMDKLDWPFSASLPHSTGATLYELANNHVWRAEFGFTDWNSFAPPFLQPPLGGKRGGEREWIDYTIGMYYAFLDCGFRLVPTAGTATGVHPVPAGFSRVYVRMPEGFAYDGWVRGLAAGRSFVTTGPMLFATADGRDPGGTFRKAAPARLRIEGSVVSAEPLAFIEVVQDGLPVRLIMPQNGPTAEGARVTAFSTEIPFETSGWAAVRCQEEREDGRVRFAHGAPWWVEVDGAPLRPRAEEREWLIERMRAEIERSRGIVPEAGMAEYERALEAYRRIEARDDSADVARTARPPRDDADLRRWLENMLVHHRFTRLEARAATGLSLDALDAAIRRLGVDPAARPSPTGDGTLRVLPYPGGRHPRTGFLDGAIDPLRDTKLSVFAPWDASSYFVVDVPEAIFTNRGLIWLAHTHVPTVWGERALEPVEWTRREDGSLELERTLPDGVSFGTKATPSGTTLRMELWLRNGTAETVRDIRVQNCVMPKGAAGFAARTNSNKVLLDPYAAVRSEDGRRWMITAWWPCHRTWANPPVPCLHSDPRIPDCPPGETRRAVGWLSFFEGDDVKAEIRRIEATGWREPR